MPVNENTGKCLNLGFDSFFFICLKSQYRIEWLVKSNPDGLQGGTNREKSKIKIKFRNQVQLHLPHL